MNTTGLRPAITLTLADRCDASALGSCAAEVAVTFEEGQTPLLLCGHHWHVNRVQIYALKPFDIYCKNEEKS